MIDILRLRRLSSAFLLLLRGICFLRAAAGEDEGTLLLSLDGIETSVKADGALFTGAGFFFALLVTSGFSSFILVFGCLIIYISLTSESPVEEGVVGAVHQKYGAQDQKGHADYHIGHLVSSEDFEFTAVFKIGSDLFPDRSAQYD